MECAQLFVKHVDLSWHHLNGWLEQRAHAPARRAVNDLEDHVKCCPHSILLFALVLNIIPLISGAQSSAFLRPKGVGKELGCPRHCYVKITVGMWVNWAIS